MVELVAPHAPEGKKGRPPFPLQAMLRTHIMQKWFTLSDSAMEEVQATKPDRGQRKLGEFISEVQVPLLDVN